MTARLDDSPCVCGHTMGEHDWGETGDLGGVCETSPCECREFGPPPTKPLGVGDRIRYRVVKRGRERLVEGVIIQRRPAVVARWNEDAKDFVTVPGGEQFLVHQDNGHNTWTAAMVPVSAG